METRISVVIPTYRRPQLLVKCLDALYRQTLNKTAFEVIVVSDGPDGLTRDALMDWHKGKSELLFSFLSLPKKKGPAAARNLGWRSAKSPLIAFTDDDCRPMSTWLDTFCQAYPGQPLWAMTGKVEVPIPLRPTDYEWNTAQLQTAEFVTANCCCTRETLLATGGFDEQFGMAWREDSDLHFRLITHGIPITRVDEAVVRHPVRDAPWGISLREQKKGQYNALLYKKYPRLFRERIRKQPNWHYYTTVSLFVLAVTALVLDYPALSAVASIGWFVGVGLLTWKRLLPTRKSASHIAEMALTSALIPFLSIYWQYYGAVKYRALLF